MSDLKKRLFGVSLLVTVALMFIYITILVVQNGENFFGIAKMEIKSSDFPCLMGYNPPTLERLGRCIRTVNVKKLSQTARDHKCVNYRIAQNTPVCIYNPKLDVVISWSFMTFGAWEGRLVSEFSQALDRTHVTDVLDLGCNIGAYTLKAAKLGKRVIALDANIENLRLLSKSLVLGDLTKEVTLIYHAVSDVYSYITLTARAPKNIGGKHIRLINEDSETETGSLVETILLDDMEHLFRDKIVAIKIDIESSELVALNGGRSFLKNIDVRFIQIEVGHHKREQSGAYIVSLLASFGFKPYGDCSFVNDLTKLPLKQWPFDVCFKKQP